MPAPPAYVTRTIDRHLPGTNITRYLGALVRANNDAVRARDEAVRQLADSPLVAAALAEHVAAPHMTRAAVGALTTTSPPGLAARSELAREAFLLLAGASAFGQLLPLMRRADFQRPTNVATETTGGAWVGEGAPVPLVAPAFTARTLAYCALAAVTVQTREAFRLGATAESAARAALVSGLQQRVDDALFNPTYSATASSPASLTNLAQLVTSAGTSGLNLLTDLDALLAAVSTPSTSLRFVLRPRTFYRALGKLASVGAGGFPANTLIGVAVVLSAGVPDGQIALLDCQSVLVATDEQVGLDIALEGDVEMLDGSLSQDGSVGTGSTLTSLFQNNLAAIRAQLGVNWTATAFNAGSSPEQAAGCAYVVVGY